MFDPESGGLGYARAYALAVKSKSCFQLQSETAQKRADMSVETVQGATGDSVKDYCLGAVITEVGRQKRSKGRPLTASDYQCSGERASVYLSSKGATVISTGAKDVAKGKCETVICQEGKPCQRAKLTDAKSKETLKKALDQLLDANKKMSYSEAQKQGIELTPWPLETPELDRSIKENQNKAEDAVAQIAQLAKEGEIPSAAEMQNVTPFGELPESNLADAERLSPKTGSEDAQDSKILSAYGICYQSGGCTKREGEPKNYDGTPINAINGCYKTRTCDHITVAGPESRLGETGVIPKLEYIDPLTNKKVTEYEVPYRMADTGNSFNKPFDPRVGVGGPSGLDIPLEMPRSYYGRSDLINKSLNSQPFSAQQVAVVVDQPVSQSVSGLGGTFSRANESYADATRDYGARPLVSAPVLYPAFSNTGTFDTSILTAPLPSAASFPSSLSLLSRAQGWMTSALHWLTGR